jgi:hypothetical protein
MGALIGETGGGLLFRGTEGYERKALGWVSLLMGAQLGNMERTPLLGTSRYG